MEKLPCPPHVDGDAVVGTVPLAKPSRAGRGDWRQALPALAGSLVTLRELRMTDASSLYTALAGNEVERFISPPPVTHEGFEKFIAWMHQQRSAGQYACFAVVARGSDTALGLFQVRSIERDFGIAEWGFALAPEAWGTGFFVDGARMAISFAFDTLGSHRLEARASVANARGNAALRKLGAFNEGLLRRSFVHEGKQHDQALWTILAEDWREAREGAGLAPMIH